MFKNLTGMYDYVASLIEAGGGLGVDKTQTIFKQSIQDYLTNEIDFNQLTQVADKLLNSFNDPAKLYKMDRNLFSILHDTDHYSPELRRKLGEYLEN